jgi:hypothetical protein
VYLWPFFYLRLALAATESAMLAADHLRFTAPFKESEKINWAFDLPPVAKHFFLVPRFQIC